MARRESPVSEYLASIGKKGGEARVPKGLAMLSEEQRKAIAAKGLATRRAKARAKKKNRSSSPTR
jgi:hypothetical protein